MKRENNTMNFPRNLILLLVILATVSLITPARTASAQTCMQDLAGFGLTCSASDVKVAIYHLIDGPLVCVPGEDISVTLQAEMLATSFERYDIGLFVARDGGNALTGSCYRDYLPPPLFPSPPSCTGTPDPNSGIGPYYNAECADDPLDTCGDLPGGIIYLKNLQPITIKCADSSSTGQSTLDMACKIVFSN